MDATIKCTSCGAIISSRELFCPECLSMQVEIPVESSLEYQKFYEKYEASKNLMRIKQQEALERYRHRKKAEAKHG